MRRRFILSCAFLLACSGTLVGIGRAEGAGSAAQPKASPSATVHPALEPKAVAMLQAMSHRLAVATALQFSATETFESLSRQGHPLAYTTKYEVSLGRPDKLRVLIVADGPASDFYYNGTTITALAPKENLVAVAPAPPTIDAMLKAVYDSAAIYFPFTDVIVAHPYNDMAPGLQRAYYVGQSNVVGDTTTNMVAFVDNGVFEQVWIGVSDGLPRRIRAVFLDDPARLRHQLEFSNWQVDPALSADTFTPTVPADAKHIKFAHPEAPMAPKPGKTP